MDVTIEPEIADYPAAGPYGTGLWARARDWLSIWSQVFPPEEIARDGLSRRLALRCCNWLWHLEATVRRLIIAAALAFDPAKLPLPGARAAEGSNDDARASSSAHSPARSRGFRILSVRGAGAPRSDDASARTATGGERHLPYPSDHLLRLGAVRALRPRQPSPRQPNPLHRRGRMAPHHPDYAPPEADWANSDLTLFGSRSVLERESESPREPHATGRRLRAHVDNPPDESEWRRIEAEWARVLPAPGLAARIAALVCVMDAPERQVERLARRLNAQPDLADMLRCAPPPIHRRPRYDRFGPQVDEDLVPLAHAALSPPDTS